MDKKFLSKVLSGLADKNIRFNDLTKLLLDLGFEKGVKGDHYIFTRHDILEIINLQPLKDGKAKAYQVKQIRNIIIESKLHMEVF